MNVGKSTNNGRVQSLIKTDNGRKDIMGAANLKGRTNLWKWKKRTGKHGSVGESPE